MSPCFAQMSCEIQFVHHIITHWIQMDNIRGVGTTNKVGMTPNDVILAQGGEKNQNFLQGWQQNEPMLCTNEPLLCTDEL